MSITIETMPVLCLLWVVLGVVFIIVSVIRLGNHQESEDHYVTLNREQGESKNDLEELFSYYLEEEEKKNQGFRELLLTTLKTQDESVKQPLKEHQKIHTGNESIYSEVIKRYEEGENIEMIAKNLKKGVGEVKLILSLYSMK